MLQEKQLYRETALNAKQGNWLGEIVLIRPISFAFLTTFATLLVLLVVAFLFFGSYARRSTVTGQLVPDTGLIKVYAPQPGIVLEKRVKDGQQVRRGEVLYVLSSERQGNHGLVQANISRQVEFRQRSLYAELSKTKQWQQEEREAVAQKKASLRVELAKLNSQIEDQTNRVKLAEEALRRYQGLFTQDYISREQLQQKQEELLDQRARLQSLERERIGFSREVTALKNDQESLPLKHESQLATIDRSIAATDQELTESEAKRWLVITAPESGTAATELAEVGQTVGINNPLISIIPTAAKLQAHLYAPSKAIGFIKPGDAVLLRYQAYPYQKFGHYRGTVTTIARTTLPPGEPTGIANLINNSGSEPLYRITVELSSQTIKAYGKPQPLQAGMLLEADVLQDTRRLYEWVLEPLFSLSGKL